MATDPYHTFAADLRSSLSSAQNLAQHYRDLTQRQIQSGRGSTSTSNATESEIRTTFDRLQDSLEALESDIGDVRESVQMVEVRGPERFGVEPDELARRKAFVRECEKSLTALSDGFLKVREDRNAGRGSIRKATGARGDEDESDEDEEDATLAFEMEHQQQLASQQDSTLDLIGNTLTSLRRQAGTLGQEIGEQVEMIGALDSEVDSSQSKLTRALGRMDELVRRSDDRMGGWCVWILIIVSTQHAKWASEAGESGC